MPPSSAPPPTQLWKRSDAAANKDGPCQTVYWVAPKPSVSSIRSLPGAPSSVVRSKRRFVACRTYKGEWQGNRKHGYGVERLSDGSIYEGRFSQDKRSGEGSLFVTDASTGAIIRTYTGHWKAGKRDGVGVYSYDDGSRYEGQWQRGQRHGTGTLFFANGDTYTGAWDRGQQSGFGSLVKGGAPGAAGKDDVYEGMYVRGRREGQGMYFYAQQGKVFDGEWVNDQPVTGIIMSARDFFLQQQRQHSGDPTAAVSSPAASRPSTSSALRTSFTMSRPSSAAMLRVARSSLTSPCSSSLSSTDTPLPLPVLRLASADTVLSSQLERLTLERSPFRSLASLPPLSSLYPQETVIALRQSWDVLRSRKRKEEDAALLDREEREVLRTAEVEEWVTSAWREVLGRKGRVAVEEVRRAMKELGKGDDAEAAGASQLEREELEASRSRVHDRAVLGFDTSVYVLWLVEQGRVVGQLLREEDSKKKAQEPDSRPTQREPTAAVRPVAAEKSAQEEKQQMSLQAVTAASTETHAAVSGQAAEDEDDSPAADTAPVSELAAAALFGAERADERTV